MKLKYQEGREFLVSGGAKNSSSFGETWKKRGATGNRQKSGKLAELKIAPPLGVQKSRCWAKTKLALLTD